MWKWGLKLLLSILKATPSSDSSLPSLFEELLSSSSQATPVFEALTLELQSALLAILSLSGAVTQRIAELVPQAKEVCNSVQ